MEGGPNPQGQEFLQQPDLLEVFGDREITVFGITGTFKELADGFCPVDLSDPRFTTEMKNEFIVKAANEAGLEIEPEYESLFAQIIEEKGLERKFTIAEVIKPEARKPIMETPKPSKTESPVIAIPQATHPERLPPIVTNKVEIGSLIAANVHQRVTSMITNAEAAAAHQVARDSELVPEPALTDSIEEPMMTEPISAEKFVTDIIDAAALDVQTASILSPVTEILPFNSYLISSDEAPANPVDFDGLESFFKELGMGLVDEQEQIVEEIQPILVDAPARPTHEVIESPASVWMAELIKEPEELLEDFTEGLRLFSEQFFAPQDKTEGEVVDESVEKQDAPPILMTVTERLILLSEPEQIEQAAEIVKNIAGAIHGLKLLETSGAPTEKMEMVKAKLEELCVTLFESLGITEYTELDIKLFMAVLLHKEFKPSSAAKFKLDPLDLLELEHLGTHEARRAHGLIGSGLVGVLPPLEHLLGMFVLFKEVRY